jgi:uncharacterized RDD family membrane protein YckC
MTGPAPALVLTPEHVEIRLEPAGFGSRFLAFMFDFLVVLGAMALIGTVVSSLLPRALSQPVQITATLALMALYHVYFESRARGQSPGKRALGLRVVDARGLPLTFRQALVRNVVRSVDVLPLAYGFGSLACAVDRRRRRLGDLAADTLVVRERTPAAFELDLPAQRRHNSLREPAMVRRIRHRIGLEDRELLLALCLRAEALDAKARFDLMEEAANHYRRKLGVEDTTLSGEAFVRALAAVLHERRTG